MGWDKTTAEKEMDQVAYLAALWGHQPAPKAKEPKAETKTKEKCAKNAKAWGFKK